MNCPYCNDKMEKGHIGAQGRFPLITWYDEKDFDKKGKIAAINRKPVITIRPEINGLFRNSKSYYCQKCFKVFGEFSVE